jgi:hypothetical protein
MFNRDCLIFNKEVFKFLQLYSETTSKFRSSSIFKFKTLTVDPESEWKQPDKDTKERAKKAKKLGEEINSKKSGDEKKAKRTAGKEKKVSTGVTKRKRLHKKEELNDSLP